MHYPVLSGIVPLVHALLTLFQRENKVHVMVYYFPLRGDEMEIEVSKDSKKKSARGYFSQNSNRRHSFEEWMQGTHILHRFAFWNAFYSPFFFKFQISDDRYWYRFYFSTKIYDLRRLWKKERVKSEESWEITMIGRLEINNSHIRKRCDFSRRWRECNWPCIKAKRLMTRPRYMYTLLRNVNAKSSVTR